MTITPSISIGKLYIRVKADTGYYPCFTEGSIQDLITDTLLMWRWMIVMEMGIEPTKSRTREEFIEWWTNGIKDPEQLEINTIMINHALDALHRLEPNFFEYPFTA